MSSAREEIAACGGGLAPERTIFRGAPTRPEFVEGGEMVGRVGEARAFGTRGEEDHFVVFIEERAGGDGDVCSRVSPEHRELAGDWFAVAHVAEQPVGFGFVVVDSGTVAPAVCGEI